MRRYSSPHLPVKKIRMKNSIMITGVKVVDNTAEVAEASKERTVFAEEALLIEAASQTVRQAARRGLKPGALVVGVDGVIEGWQEVFFKRVMTEGPLGASPMEFPFTSPNALAARLSMRFEIKGESLTITSGPLSFLKALVYASELVRGGIAEAVLVGGVAAGKAITLLVDSARGEVCIEDLGERVSGEQSSCTIEESFDAFTRELGKARSDGSAEQRSFLFSDSSGHAVYFRFRVTS